MRFAATVLGAVVLCTVSLVSLPATAQDWPQRPVRMIVPLGPGAGVDIGARLLGERLAARWGQSVVVDNRPGGDGVIAMTAYTAAQDDHTLLMSPTSSFVHHPFVLASVPYDQRDLVPIARVSNTVVTIVIPASSPIGTLSELIAAARAEPGKLNWAGITGFFDFVFEGFLKKAGLEITRVPYRNTVAAANDLAEDRIQLMMAAYAIVSPLVQAGKLKLLAITARERASALAHVPTAAEAGFPDLTIEGLVGLFGPLELSSAAAERIAADVREFLRDPVIMSRLESTGQVVNFGTPAEFAAAIELQRTQAAETARLLGPKAPQ